MVPTESHPNPAQLSRLALSRRMGAQAPALRAHIETCADCRHLATLFEQVTWTLATAKPAMTLPHPVKERVITRLRGGRGDWEEEGRPAVSSGNG